MSRLFAFLFPRRVAREAELAARVDHYAGRCQELEDVAEAALYNQRRLAHDLEERNRELARAVCVIKDLSVQLEDRPAEKSDRDAEVENLREELAAAKRSIGHLQDRLDDAMGLNSVHVQAGARWQENRTDKKVRS